MPEFTHSNTEFVLHNVDGCAIASLNVEMLITYEVSPGLLKWSVTNVKLFDPVYCLENYKELRDENAVAIANMVKAFLNSNARLEDDIITAIMRHYNQDGEDE